MNEKILNNWQFLNAKAEELTTLTRIVGPTDPAVERVKEIAREICETSLEKLNGGIKANCEPTIEPAKYECFGKLIWKWIKENPEFLGDEFSLTLMPMAENSGLCKHEVYDPEKHGEMEGLVPGEDGIYWCGRNYE